MTLVGCASKKPSNENSKAESSHGNDLILNGSSDNGTAGDLKTIYFPFNESFLSTDAKATLKNNAEYLKSNSSLFVQIEGHCDERGSSQHNLALGEKRAKIIKDYLNALGVKSFRLKTLSWGSEKPIEHVADESSWSKNRRGSFVIIEK